MESQRDKTTRPAIGFERSNWKPRAPLSALRLSEMFGGVSPLRHACLSSARVSSESFVSPVDPSVSPVQ